MDLQERLVFLLKNGLNAERVVLEDDGGISGVVVSPDFRGISAIDRQRRIDRVLRSPQSGLTRAELKRILGIAALTPVEYELGSFSN